MRLAPFAFDSSRLQDLLRAVFDIFEGAGQIPRVAIAKRLLDGLKTF